MLRDRQISARGPIEGASVLGVIPARLASKRLPGKPLRLIAGRPLIEWVWRRARELRAFDELIIAAADREIVEVVEAFGGRAVLTRNEHRSGTERVAEAARRPEHAGFECVVNLQGDEPFMPARAIEAAVSLAVGGWDIGTAAVPFGDAAEWKSRSAVKVVRDEGGGALAFSRSPIRQNDGGAMGTRRLRHIGVYAFSRAALRQATQLPPHPLERREALEQLRWLASGLRIGVAVVEGGEPGIDTEADLIRAERILTRRREFP